MTASREPALAERSVQRRFPDFFIVGHAKCGTTALYEMLRRHGELDDQRLFAAHLDAVARSIGLA